MRTINGKKVLKLHKAMDVNGNGVWKIFYSDGTTEIARGSKYADQLPWFADKFYKSLSGLYQSK